MAKTKVSQVFFCQNCGYESSKWMGQCPACHEWNAFVEERVIKGSTNSTAIGTTRALKPLTLNEIHSEDEERFVTGIEEYDRVLGGGIVQIGRAHV